MEVCSFYGITLSEALTLPDWEINTVLEYISLKNFIKANSHNKDFTDRLSELMK